MFLVSWKVGQSVFFVFKKNENLLSEFTLVWGKKTSLNIFVRKLCRASPANFDMWLRTFHNLWWCSANSHTYPLVCEKQHLLEYEFAHWCAKNDNFRWCANSDIGVEKKTVGSVTVVIINKNHDYETYWFMYYILCCLIVWEKYNVVDGNANANYGNSFINSGGKVSPSVRFSVLRPHWVKKLLLLLPQAI